MEVRIVKKSKSKKKNIKKIEVDFIKIGASNEKNLREAKLENIEGRKEIPHEYWLRKSKTTLKVKDDLLKDLPYFIENDARYLHMLDKISKAEETLSNNFNEYSKALKNKKTKREKRNEDHKVMKELTQQCRNSSDYGLINSVLSIKTHKNKK